MGWGFSIRGRESTVGIGIVVLMIVDYSSVGDLLEEDWWVDVLVGIILFRTGMEFEGGADCTLRYEGNFSTVGYQVLIPIPQGLE